MKKLAQLFRKYTQCKPFDIHWSMKYDSGMTFDIGRSGICSDCGYRTEGIEWVCPPMPKCKPPNTHGRDDPFDKMQCP